MCLSKVYKKKPAKSGIGYKVFLYDCTRQKYHFEIRPHKADTEGLELGGTYVAEEHPVKRSTVSYTSGFHIFKWLEDAMAWRSFGTKVVKVKYSEAHTCGTQTSFYAPRAYTIIAREIKLIEGVKDPEIIDD